MIVLVLAAGKMHNLSREQDVRSAVGAEETLVAIDELPVCYVLA